MRLMAWKTGNNSGGKPEGCTTKKSTDEDKQAIEMQWVEVGGGMDKWGPAGRKDIVMCQQTTGLPTIIMVRAAHGSKKGG